jgi:hypothetical protein
MNRTDVDESAQQAASHHERRSAGRGGWQGAVEHGGVELARLREAGANIGSQIQEQARKRPYVVIGAAAGLGFVAGSLLGSRLGQVLLAAGVGYVVRNVLQDGAVERLQDALDRLGKPAREQMAR